jgi:hypothetical protein
MREATEGWWQSWEKDTGITPEQLEADRARLLDGLTEEEIDELLSGQDAAEQAATIHRAASILGPVRPKPVEPLPAELGRITYDPPPGPAAQITGDFGLDDADLAAGPKRAGKSKLDKAAEAPLLVPDADGAPRPPPGLGERIVTAVKNAFTRKPAEEAAEEAAEGPRNVMAEQAAKDIKAHPRVKKPWGERLTAAGKEWGNGIKEFVSPGSVKPARRAKSVLRDPSRLRETLARSNETNARIMAERAERAEKNFIKSKGPERAAKQ